MTGVHFTGVLVPFTRVFVSKFALTRFALRLLLMVLLSFMSGSRSPAVPYLELTALGEPRSWRRRRKEREEERGRRRQREKERGKERGETVVDVHVPWR